MRRLLALLKKKGTTGRSIEGRPVLTRANSAELLVADERGARRLSLHEANSHLR